MILDTRGANLHVKDPEYGQLPTSGPGVPYRHQRMARWLSPRSISTPHFTGLRCLLVWKTSLCCPPLIAICFGNYGLTWPTYFPLDREQARSLWFYLWHGTGVFIFINPLLSRWCSKDFCEAEIVKDRNTCPSFAQEPIAAAYVDGVVVISHRTDLADAKCLRVLDVLEKAGLPCKGLVAAGDDQTFTGLVFEKDRGQDRRHHES